jgi:hypothetical protein
MQNGGRKYKVQSWPAAAVALLAIGLLATESLPWQGRALETRTPERAGIGTPTQAAEAWMPVLPILDPGIMTGTLVSDGIIRRAVLHTVSEHRRIDIIQYTVKSGDTVFGIAETFGLKPSTVLWSNLYVLSDDPHRLSPKQVLTILPVDGVYYDWHANDGLNGVARVFRVKPEDIINYPGNHLDAQTIGDLSHPNIKPGTWLIIPGGSRDFITWSAPQITRQNPAVANILGPGACGKIADGAVGTGSFVWPTTEHWLSGFDYHPEANHAAVDLAGQLGNKIFAADAGVVVYSGWNDWGYGNVIVMDHGNGWQTLYAHLSVIYAGCGYSVTSGALIGLMGSTGRSTGPHLHFELMKNGAKVNPHDFLPPP